MKFLHFADFHLGMENYGRIGASGLHQRVEEFLAVLDEMCEHVERDGIDMVFFSGDAFKNREPSQTLVVAFAQRIRRFVQGGAQVFLLIGNHDMPVHAVKANTLDIYSALEMKGVYVGRDFGSVEVEIGSAEKVRVVFAPWVNKQRVFTDPAFLSGAGLSVADAALLPQDEIGSLLGNYVIQRVTELCGGGDDDDDDDDAGTAHAYGKVDDVTTVVLAHGTVESAVFGAERSVMLGTDVVLPLIGLKKLPVSYVALGHIHKHQVLAGSADGSGGDGPVIVYSGSPVRIDFSEEADVKGYIVGEIGGDDTRSNADDLRVVWELVESGAASFHTIVIDLHAGVDEGVVTEVRARLAAISDLAMAVVRVVVRGSRDELACVDDALVSATCSDVRHFVGVVREVVDEHGVLLSDRGGVSGDASLSGVVRDWEDVAAKPLSLIQEYLGHSEGDVKRRKRLERLAKGLIDEVLEGE